MDNDFKTAVALLKQGHAPGNAEVLSEITVGVNSLTEFIKTQYFADYIAHGGSKIKFVTGKEGCGKTHFLQFLSSAARDMGFVTVHISARECWLHDFKDVYMEIFKHSDLTAYLTGCASRIVEELGHNAGAIPEGMTFVDYLSSIGELDALIKKEIRNQLREMFLKNPFIDNNFAIACSLLAGGILGHPVLEASNRALLLSWLSGSRDIKLQALRNLGLSPTKITKYNARHMLRSLVEVQRLASFPGTVIMIDNVEILASSTTMDTIRYTRLKREDAYESIRELIDEIDTLKNIMFFFAFDRKLIDDELSGLKSYQALWMRIQNEIVSNRFNQFTDIIDLDKFGDSVFGRDTLMDMSDRLAGVINRLHNDAAPINGQTADEILANSQFTKTSVPRQVGLATLHGYTSGGGHND